MQRPGNINYKVVQIELLDGSDVSRSIYKRTKTKEILENIFQMLNIIEKDFFGLYFINMQTDSRIWLKNNDTIWSQIVKAMEPPYQMYFGVKYFPYDPLLLQEDITLYMMYLQLRREVKDGRAICSEHERAEMLAHILQAEAGDHGENYIHKHRNFFVNLQRTSPDLERTILDIYSRLKGMDPPQCELKLMEKALEVTYYNQEMYHVRSDAQPGLKRLTLTLGPVGVGLYQSNTKLDIFGWMEIWNVGYINNTFWFRVVREGEKSKHKFHFDNNKTCEHVWKTFRDFFQFYIQDRKVDPKLLWGRIPPKVQRVTLISEQHATPAMRHANVVPKISKDNFSSLLTDPGNFGNSMATQEHFIGASTAAVQRNGGGGFQRSIFTADNTLTGMGSLNIQDKGHPRKLEDVFQQSSGITTINSKAPSVDNDTENDNESEGPLISAL